MEQKIDEVFKETKVKKHKHTFLKIFIVLFILCVLIGGAIFALKFGPNYINRDITDRTNLVINYTNVTGKMKQEMIIEDDIVYLSLNDIMNYYDKHIYYDNQYNQIVTTSETKVGVLKLNENKITINGVSKKINGKAFVKNDIYYLPISEMEDVYNIKVMKADNKIIIESLDKKLTTGVASKNIKIKSKTTMFSRTVEKVSKDESVVIAETEENSLKQGWIKVRTQNGNLGYVEEKEIKDKKVEREQLVLEKQIEGKISLAWDYFSEFGKAPDNTDVKYDGVNVVSPSFLYLKLKDTKQEKPSTIDLASQARVIDNIGEEGEAYINWAHSNNYKVWAKFSNETLTTTIDEFSYIINDYKLREIMIKDILNYVDKFGLDGINLDFEYMYQNDKDAFSKFVIELAPQLRAKGKCLSVDVTAPNGGENWSLCYDRNTLGEVADYIVFMGYDQYGTTTIGTTSGYNWVENSLNSMFKYDEVPSDKIILGLPFYTKLWQTKGDKTIKGTVVPMKNIQNSIPQNASKEWKEDLKQYYIQYEQGEYVYKMWIEDNESFKEKLELVNKYNLAGAGYWRKGFEDDGIWSIIKESLNL